MEEMPIEVAALPPTNYPPSPQETDTQMLGKVLRSQDKIITKISKLGAAQNVSQGSSRHAASRAANSVISIAIVVRVMVCSQHSNYVLAAESGDGLLLPQSGDGFMGWVDSPDKYLDYPLNTG